jgi:phasin
MTTKTAKAQKTASPFEAFAFPSQSFEVPAAFRELADQSVTQARDTYAKFKEAADDATGLVGETFETAREGAYTFGVKALDAVKSNADASFAHAKDLFGARTVSEVIELQSAFARKQFDAFTSQFRELQALGEKIVTEAVKPVAEKVEKTVKDMKVA